MQALIEVLKLNVADIITTSTSSENTQYNIGGECGEPEIDEE